MHIVFLNPQGNFDPQDRYWTEHPDFGGQLVYVKEVALSLGRMGHQVDVVTRRIQDPDWEGFAAPLDQYPGEPGVRILRMECGGEGFLPKEALWPHLGEWVHNLQTFYLNQGVQPEVVTTHYGDGGLAGALWQQQGGPPFSFTGHSLGAQKLDRLLALGDTLADLDAKYHFARRIAAERVAMNHAAVVITSTRQERLDQYGHEAYRSAIDPKDDAKFTILPPGVNLGIFDADLPGPADTRIAAFVEERLARDIQSNRIGLPAIISASRLDPKKNIVGLVQAFASNPQLQRCANLILVVRGIEDLHSRTGLSVVEKEILEAIEEIARSTDLWGKISGFPLNSQQELAAAYRALSLRRSVFVLTALYEPFGLAPLEAMAAGLPVVVTRNGGPSESLREPGRDFGVLVDPSDSADIARGLLEVVGPENRWKALQRAGRERVKDKYTWEQTARGYLQTLEKMPAPHPTLPVPAYFTQPLVANDIPIESLTSFSEGSPGRRSTRERG